MYIDVGRYASHSLNLLVTFSLDRNSPKMLRMMPVMRILNQLRVSLMMSTRLSIVYGTRRLETVVSDVSNQQSTCILALLLSCSAVL